MSISAGLSQELAKIAVAVVETPNGDARKGALSKLHGLLSSPITRGTFVGKLPEDLQLKLWSVAEIAFHCLGSGNVSGTIHEYLGQNKVGYFLEKGRVYTEELQKRVLAVTGPDGSKEAQLLELKQFLDQNEVRSVLKERIPETLRKALWETADIAFHRFHALNESEQLSGLIHWYLGRDVVARSLLEKFLIPSLEQHVAKTLHIDPYTIAADLEHFYGFLCTAQLADTMDALGEAALPSTLQSKLFEAAEAARLFGHSGVSERIRHYLGGTTVRRLESQKGGPLLFSETSSSSSASQSSPASSNLGLSSLRLEPPDSFLFTNLKSLPLLYKSMQASAPLRRLPLFHSYHMADFAYSSSYDIAYPAHQIALTWGMRPPTALQHLGRNILNFLSRWKPEGAAVEINFCAQSYPSGWIGNASHPAEDEWLLFRPHYLLHDEKNLETRVALAFFPLSGNWTHWDLREREDTFNTHPGDFNTILHSPDYVASPNNARVYHLTSDASSLTQLYQGESRALYSSCIVLDKGGHAIRRILTLHWLLNESDGRALKNLSERWAHKALSLGDLLASLASRSFPEGLLRAVYQCDGTPFHPTTSGKTEKKTP